MQSPIQLPPEGDGLQVIASVSGGKDSTALILALREAGISARYVFADTGWEAPETYAYLDTLRSVLDIVIDVVRAASGGMRESVKTRARFPGRMQRWCTAELKITPLRAYHDALISADPHRADTVNAMGIRGDESPARNQALMWEDDAEWGGYLWRPLLRWSIEDVLLIHRRHGLPVNPLYQRGHNRVGCYPCIYASKPEIKLVAKYAPYRIVEIRELEKFCTDERVIRNDVDPERYKHPIASFFQSRSGRRVEACKLAGTEGHDCGDPDALEWPATCVVKRKLVDAPPMQIDEIVAWARTDRGGRQLPMFEEAPTGGCMRWGLCETEPSSGSK